MPKSTTKTADHPEHATEPTPMKPQGSHPPRMMQIQPPELEQDQQINKTNEQKQQETTKQHAQGAVGKMKCLQVPKRMGKKGKTTTDGK